MTMSGTKFRAAAVQAAPVYLDVPATLNKTIRLIDEAASQSAALVVFGEAWLPGYPFWVWLDGAFANLPRFKAYREASIERTGSELEAIRRAARDRHIAVAVGYSERDGGTLYLAQSIFDQHGVTICHRRKLRPTMAERMVYGEGGGMDLQVYQTDLGRIGALCCWEHLNPLTKYALYSQREQVHIAAWPSFGLDTSRAYALGHEVNNAVSQVYAAEGQCFVLAPTSIIDEATVQAVADRTGAADPFRRGGGFTMIYGPDGRPLNDPLDEMEEGLVYADIDLDAIDLAKIAADPIGHYARPDVTRLWFNRSPTPCVQHPEEDVVIPEASPGGSSEDNSSNGEVAMT